MGITVHQLAREAGVSPTTVSRVLNGTASAIRISAATQRRVLDAAARLSYTPNILARGLRSGRSSLVGLILGNAASLSGILQGVEQCATARGHGLLVRTTGGSGEDEMAAARFLLEKKVDGLVVSSTLYVCERVKAYISHLRDQGVPVVLLGQRHGTTPRVPFVGYDNQAVGHMATRYLLSLGHRSILCVTNTHNANTIGVLRREGYREALMEAGLATDEALVADIDPGASSYPQAAYEATRACLESGRAFTAVFSHCDWASLGVLKAVREAGLRIPQDISLIGEGEQAFADYTEPPLTTIRLDSIRAGEVAAGVLFDCLDGREVPPETLLPPQLIERGSCGRTTP